MTTGTDGGPGTRVASLVLGAVLVAAMLNGVGFGQAGAPFGFARTLVLLPVAVTAFLVGHRVELGRRPGVAVAVAGAVTALGAGVVGGVGVAATVLIHGALTALLPWLVGGALRRREQAARAAEERLDQAARITSAYRTAAMAAEREAIAADLHDHVGHDLALISLRAAGLEVASAGATRSDAAAIRELAQEATDRLRAAVGRLDGAAAPMTRAADAVARARGAGLRVELHGDSADPLVVRAVEEGMTNAARHAPGRSVRVVIDTATGDLTVTNALPDTDTTTPLEDGSSPRPAGRGLARLRDAARAQGRELEAHPFDGCWRLVLDGGDPP